MLALNPSLVRFGDLEWTDVTLIAIDRVATKVAAEWSDLGPHAAFIDTPEQRTDVKIVRTIARDDLDQPRPGQSAAVTFHTSPGAVDTGRKRIAFTGVIVAVRHEITGKTATRTIHLVAVSSDGASDPITITDAGGEP